MYICGVITGRSFIAFIPNSF